MSPARVAVTIAGVVVEQLVSSSDSKVRDGLPEEDGGPADPPEDKAVFAPVYAPEELAEIARKLLAHA